MIGARKKKYNFFSNLEVRMTIDSRSLLSLSARQSDAAKRRRRTTEAEDRGDVQTGT